jgi:predicted DCC family thiol-disulfide oxidoreductase YuxK
MRPRQSRHAGTCSVTVRSEHLRATCETWISLNRRGFSEARRLRTRSIAQEVEGSIPFGCTSPTAAPRVFRLLGFPWNLFAAFTVGAAAAPRPLLRLGRNRYRWFGKRDAYMVPTPEVRSRFLE